MNDILDIIKSRRSIRRFRTDPVPGELINRVLEAGRWAPSGLNNQPWKFAVVTDPKVIDKISKFTRYSKVVLASRALIPVFLDTERSYHREKDIQAVGACLQNMLLEAHALGIGAVWLGEIIRSGSQVMEVLGLTGQLELMAVLALGYPDGRPGTSKRSGLKELLVYRD